MDNAQVYSSLPPSETAESLERAERLEQQGAQAYKHACYAEARQSYEEALVLREPIQGTHPAVARTLQHLGEIAQGLAERDLATVLFQRAFRISEQTQGRDHPESLHLLGEVAMIQLEQGQVGQAQSLLQEVSARAEQALGPAHLETARAACNLACFWQRQRDYEQAEPLFQRAVAIVEQQPQHDPLVLALILNRFGVLYLDWNRLAAAEPLLLRAMTLWRRSVASDHPALAMAFKEIGRLALLRGNETQALSLTERALSIVQTKLSVTHPERIHLEQSCQSLRTRLRLQTQQIPPTGTLSSQKGPARS